LPQSEIEKVITEKEKFYEKSKQNSKIADSIIVHASDDSINIKLSNALEKIRKGQYSIRYFAKPTKSSRQKNIGKGVKLVPDSVRPARFFRIDSIRLQNGNKHFESRKSILHDTASKGRRINSKIREP
jgi:hypothetical protein